MDLQLKPISKDGIPEAISKAELYRYLNEPGEAESICRDILAADAENQAALRLMGLSITDQFTGNASDRYNEAENTFQNLTDPYQRSYYAGILHDALRFLEDCHEALDVLGRSRLVANS